MVHVVSLDFCVDLVLLVVFVHVIEQLVPLSELSNHELLKLYNINHIEQCLNLIQHHDAKLVSDATEAEFLHDGQHGFDDLSPNVLWDELEQFNVWMRRLGNFCPHHQVLST